MNKGYDLIEILNHIDPALLTYQEWVNVGMGLKEAGYAASDWDNWSSGDRGRYHPGECLKKWESFTGAAKPVTAGTVVQYAREQGWYPVREEYELDWDAEIGGKDDLVVVNHNWLENKDIREPALWDPAKELITYLKTLFEASENVGYVSKSYQNDENKYVPANKGNFDRTAGELIHLLAKCNGDIGAVIGDYAQEAGAWIRFNPLDGKGVKNENVTDFRYALVESDVMEIEQQNAIIRELELPVACLVHSGKKSLHAVVKIDASSYDEYRKRVDYLYNICQKNGLKIDSQNRNPSRLSRMPGVMRGEQRQFIVDTNIGKESWHEWQEWIESVNDDLPEPESMASVWDNLPKLSEPLINGVLRQGHKMLIAGPSKAGKSYALIEMCCAIAEGKNWLNWQCTQGKILYVNLELDRASCLHRFKDVYTALGWKPDSLNNIDIWNLRGKSVPMDKLAPKLIRRAAKKSYIAIIIDPIYKVITGDENSADQMAHFCNQFDKVCTELGCAVIYCHHHSKGGQGSKKSMDRASGSGVFARDPDALLDLIELEITDNLLKQQQNKAACKVYTDYLFERVNDWEDKVSQDDLCSEKAMQEACKSMLTNEEYSEVVTLIITAKKATESRSAWRIEGTLREFPKFSPVNLWFDYPIHTVDCIGVLQDVDAEGDKAPWQRAVDKRKKNADDEKKNKRTEFENTVSSCNFGEPPTVEMLCETLSLSKRSIERKMNEYGYVSIKGKVYHKTVIDNLPSAT